MKIGQLKIENHDLMIAVGAIGLVALFGHDVAKQIADKAVLARTPLAMLPQFSEMKTIVVDELVDD